MRLTFDDYVLDVARRELWRGSEPVAVEPQVFDLLVYLAQNPDRVVTKDELLQAVWDGRIVSESAITNRINAARRAIGDSGGAQRLIRTVPRKGFRFIGAIEEHRAEPAKAAVPLDRSRRGFVAQTFAAAVSALLGAAIAAFLLWPRAGPPWRLAVETRSAGAPMTAPAGGLRLIAGLPSAVVGKGADQLNLPPSLTNVATELSRGSVLIVTSLRRAPVHLDEAVNAAPIGPSAPEGGQPPAPNVTAPPLAAPVRPPYVRSPGKSYAYTGRYRVEEDKFPEVPCTVTRIASSAGGQCLRGYRGLGCDKAIDVVTFTVANLSIEASVLIFDPYKLTATGSASRCYIAGHPGYDQEDFQDMNQVTRRGTNWHNLVIDEQDRQNRSIEFSERGHACVAVLRHGPVWRGGYVWTLHASICRTDAAPVQAQDVAYVLGSLQTRIYDPVGNLRSPDDWTTYGPPAR